MMIAKCIIEIFCSTINCFYGNFQLANCNRLPVRCQGGGLREALRIPGRARESQGGAATFEKYVG